jgi:hypothetical protein
VASPPFLLVIEAAYNVLDELVLSAIAAGMAENSSRTGLLDNYVL